MIARKLGLGFSLVVVLLLIPAAAHADTTFTTGSGCSSCYGGTYSINFVGTANPNTFVVTLTITAPNGGVTAGQFISGVGFGTGKVITLVTPVTPGGTVGGTWSTTFDNINSNDTCSGAGPGKKICSEQQKTGSPAIFTVAAANGSTYTWQWIVTFATPGLNDLGDVHIQAQYQDAGGSPGNIVSQDASLPEPATAATLGIGLFLLAFRLRRRS